MALDLLRRQEALFSAQLLPLGTQEEGQAVKQLHIRPSPSPTREQENQCQAASRPLKRHSQNMVTIRNALSSLGS